ncbi:hypothetical protein AVEN_172504-1 [Araneus ventricosus]|uniref:Uncharacterized protein n=1 Tax=Araneus ventricosus TaxID=182803 RepID=A0A4Y2DRY9_ARAVE|nr:hypothetical protein AVEN_172504-1 [Araneus ventricosus]
MFIRLHHACIRNASEEYGSCTKSSFSQSVAEANGNRRNETSEGRTLKIICRSHEVFTECFTAAVEKSCGQDAADFVGTILTRPTASLRIPFCLKSRLRELIGQIEKELLRREELSKNST